MGQLASSIGASSHLIATRRNFVWFSILLMNITNSHTRVGPINTWSLASVAAVTAVALALVRRTSTPVLTIKTAYSMVIGMSIFTGLFAFIGTNFNYNLVFLIFAVPQLLQWIRCHNVYRDFAFTFLTVMALAVRLCAQVT